MRLRWFKRETREEEPRRAWVRAEILKRINGEAAVTVSEIDCGDPACPGLETIILIMRQGEPTRALKIAKGVDEIEPADIEDLAL